MRHVQVRFHLVHGLVRNGYVMIGKCCASSCEAGWRRPLSDGVAATCRVEIREENSDVVRLIETWYESWCKKGSL